MSEHVRWCCDGDGAGHHSESCRYHENNWPAPAASEAPAQPIEDDSSGIPEYFAEPAPPSVARLEAKNAALREALSKIAESDYECGCDHSDGNCCAKLSVDCSRCTAWAALAETGDGEGNHE